MIFLNFQWNFNSLLSNKKKRYEDQIKNLEGLMDNEKCKSSR